MLIGKKDIGIRMSTRKKLVSVLGIVLVLVALGVYGIAFSGKKGKELSFGIVQKETIHLWYTDASLTDYLNSKAVSFYEETDIRIMPPVRLLHDTPKPEHGEERNEPSHFWLF